MTAEDVDQVIIRRLRANTPYPSPRHLRADAYENTLSDYRRALARFDHDVLERAWRKAIEASQVWCWPKIGDILQAAEQAQRELHPPGRGEDWVGKAQALVDSYWRKFSKSAAAVRAREGGFEAKLKTYVTAVAWVQGQLIVRPESGVGYDHQVIFGKGPRDEAAEEEFFRKAREQAATGHIRVPVSASKVETWKAAAESSRGR